MTQDPQDVLGRFHNVLVREIRTNNPDYLDGPFSVAEIYQNLVPYRTHREEIGVEINADYEHALLQLLVGDGDYLTIESRTARQEIREELDSPNPNTGLYRDFAAADVRLNPEKVGETLVGLEGPEIEAVDEMGSAPEAPDLLPALDEEGEEALEEFSLENENEMDEEAGEVDSEDLPFEVSGPEELPQEDSPALDGEEPVGEESAPVELESAPVELESAPAELESAPAELELDSPGNCPWCRENLPHRERVQFCPFCGSNVQLVPCPECGQELELNWRFCIACGTEVSL
jgi:hypothetical protein